MTSVKKTQGEFIKVFAIENAEEQVKYVKTLIDSRSPTFSVYSIDVTGKTLLMHAATNGFIGTVQVLLANDADQLFHQDNDGNTALMLATYAGNELVVHALLEKARAMGAQEMRKHLNQENKLGETAFTIALKKGKTPCADLISDYTVHREEGPLEEALDDAASKTVVKPRDKRLQLFHLNSFSSTERCDSEPERSSNHTTSSSDVAGAMSDSKIADDNSEYHKRHEKKRSKLRNVHDMLFARRNVSKSKKIQRLFSVGSDGSPLSSDSSLYVANHPREQFRQIVTISPHPTRLDAQRSTSLQRNNGSTILPHLANRIGSFLINPSSKTRVGKSPSRASNQEEQQQQQQQHDHHHHRQHKQQQRQQRLSAKLFRNERGSLEFNGQMRPSSQELRAASSSTTLSSTITPNSSKTKQAPTLAGRELSPSRGPYLWDDQYAYGGPTPGSSHSDTGARRMVRLPPLNVTYARPRASSNCIQ